jgi:hypothetical protein
MKSFLAGVAAPLLVLAAWGIFGVPMEPRGVSRAATLVALIVLLPTACAAASAQFVAFISPRRQFDRRMRGGFFPRALAGFFGGVIATITIGALLIVADSFVSDALLTCAAGALAGSLAVLPLSRVKRGACFHCGYDLSAQPGPGQPGFGRCPECGAGVVESPAHLGTRVRLPKPAADSPPDLTAAASVQA